MTSPARPMPETGPTAPPPALLAVSHGTSSPAGQAAVASLVEAVAGRLPGVDVRLGHVDVQHPDVAESLDALGDRAVVVVPLLLSAGYHVRVDLARETGHRRGVAVARAMGPDARLAMALASRLEAAGGLPGDAIVLAVAGSSDGRANDDCVRMAGMLGERLGRDVTVGFLSAAEPRLDAAVARARAQQPAGSTRVAVATYLLAPGYFHALAARLAAGGDLVAPPLLGADAPAGELVDLVIERYRDALAT
ncbi:MAG: sirohydrochlorin chelatase [Pseudoclavibacter sp.]